MSDTPDLYAGKEDVAVIAENAVITEESPKKRTRKKGTTVVVQEEEVVETTTEEVDSEDTTTTTEEEEPVQRKRNRIFINKNTIDEDDELAGRIDDTQTRSWDQIYADYDKDDYNYNSVKGVTNLNIDRNELFLKRKFRADDVAIYMIAGSQRSAMEAYSRNPDEYYASDDPEVFSKLDAKYQRWNFSSKFAFAFSSYENDYFRYAINDPNVAFRNGIEYEGRKPRAIRTPPVSLDRAKLSNRNAIEVLRGALNMGSPVDVWLAHSGFAVTIDMPTISQLIATERKIAQNKIEVGRKTRGLVASHDLTYLQQAIFDLFAECVRSTSINITDPDLLKEAISILDMETIAWALACAKYPNGFRLSIPCLANPGECHHVQHEVVDVRKMHVYDNSKLTDKQRQIATKAGKVSPEDVSVYMGEFEYDGLNKIDLSSMDDNLKVYINLTAPSVDTTFRSATSWIANLEDSCNRAFAMPLTGRARSRYLLAQKEATNAMVYEHFVSSIEMLNVDTDEVVVIDGEEDIRNFIMTLSNDELRKVIFMQGVQKFINKAQIAFVGIPNVQCPSCHGFLDTANEDEVERHFVPLDVLSVFSILCQQLSEHYRTVAEDQEKEMMQNGVPV